MGPEDAIALVLGVAAVVALIVAPIAALVSASKARAEIDRLRIEVSRLARLLHERTDGLAPKPFEAPAAPGPVKAAPPPPPVPTPAAVPAAALPPSPVVTRLEPRREEPAEVLAERVSFEAYLGGKVFLVAGVVTALLGLGWFFKVAIDRNWIGPGVRVLVGAAAGVSALAIGDRLRARGFALFGHGLMGGGLGALYVTTYFASVRYGFLGTTAAYGVTGLLTACGAALAMHREAPLLAYLGFLGGFLAPGQLSSGEDRLWAHTAWLAILDAGVLVTAVRRRWHGLELTAVLASAAYFASWTNRYHIDSHLGDASAVLAILAAMGLATALVPPILRREAPAATALFAAFLVGLLGIVGGAEILHPHHRRALGAGVAGLAAAYLVSARLVEARGGGKGPAAALLGLALAALATAIPFVFEGRVVAPVWAATGLGLCIVAARGTSPLVAGAGAGMILLAALESLVMGRWDHGTDFTPILNPAFVAAAAPAAAFLAASFVLGRSHGEGLAPTLRVAGAWLLAAVLGYEAFESVAAAWPGRERLDVAAAAAAMAGAVLASAAAFRRDGEVLRGVLLMPMIPAFLLGLQSVFHGHVSEFDPVRNGMFGCGLAVVAACLAAGGISPKGPGKALQLVGLVFLFALATGEIYSWGRWCDVSGGTRVDAERRAQVVVSVTWAVYAAALLVAGFARARAEVRWCGIVLFAITAGKVFLYDMAELDVVYRIGSFMVLGLLLVGASFLYHRQRRNGAMAPAPAPAADVPPRAE